MKGIGGARPDLAPASLRASCHARTLAPPDLRSLPVGSRVDDVDLFLGEPETEPVDGVLPLVPGKDRFETIK